MNDTSPQIPVWRPPARIRVKAFGLHWKGPSLLAAPITTDNGTLVGVRPLGGSLHFGESWRAALSREFREELKVDLASIGSPRVIENIFEHEGVIGHEVVFVADITFAADDFADRDELSFTESNGVVHIARWYALEDIREGRIRLLPFALEPALLGEVGA